MGTRKRYSRKLAAILTVLAMVLALFPVAAFAQEQPTFKDIAGLKLAKEIEEAAKAGLIEGYPDGTFKPKQNVTRAEFAKMIVNALEQATGKALPTGEEPFSDVSEDSTLYEYVVKAYNAKLIQGYEDGRFGYSDPIQRQQAAAIIARALGLEETEENFPDVDPKYHRLAGLIGAVAKAGLMQGYDNGNFGPTDNVQRDQAAAIAVRTYNYLLPKEPEKLA
ncbi:MAG TPA: S-layer homology domain-containing protein, partial [Calditerricola sp.]